MTFLQIEGVWEATYGDKYNKGIPCGEVDSVKEKFLKGLEEAKLEGAVNDLPRFTQFMVGAVLMVFCCTLHGVKLFLS